MIARQSLAPKLPSPVYPSWMTQDVIEAVREYRAAKQEDWRAKEDVRIINSCGRLAPLAVLNRARVADRRLHEARCGLDEVLK